MTDAIDGLIRATQGLLRLKANDMAITETEIASIRRVRTPVPADLPVVQTLPSLVAQAASTTRAVAEALLRAAPMLAWRQTYDGADGFDQAYLDTYGWLDLAGPTGPCDLEGIRVMLGICCLLYTSPSPRDS